MKNIFQVSKIWLFAFLVAFSGLLFASESVSKTVADVKIELISSMEKDGYLSQKMASEVAQKYITPEDKVMNSSVVEVSKSEIGTTVSWTDYLSWINFFKVVGVIFFLIAFNGVITKLIKGLWHFIVVVPVEVYQTAFLAGTLTGLVYPEAVWESQYFYIALFSAFANIAVIGWIIVSHEKIAKFIEKIFNLGVPVSCVASFYGMIYFGILAFVYHSSIFGFFAAVCLSGIFSFGLYYYPGVLVLNFKENMLNSVVFGHLLVLGVYAATFKQFPQYFEYFNVGIQYYCTVALCVGLLVGASPFYKKESAIGFATVFVALFFAATYGYFFYDLKVVSSIIFSFFILFVLEWISYIGYRSGAILGSAMIGGSLYGLAMLLEKFGSMIILKLV